MTYILLLVAFGLDGVLEAWHWRRAEPLHPDYYHPIIFCRNAAFVLAVLCGGLSVWNLLGVSLFGSLVLRESAINIMGRGCIPWRKQPLLGFPRYPWIEAAVGVVLGLYLMLGV